MGGGGGGSRVGENEENMGAKDWRFGKEMRGRRAFGKKWSGWGRRGTKKKDNLEGRNKGEKFQRLRHRNRREQRRW